MSTNWKVRLGEDENGFWGDATLYLGMFTDVGMPDAAEELAKCIDSNGRLWRNPLEAQEQVSPYSHGTSRDMLAGFILGCLKHQNGKAMLESLISYIRANDSKLAPSGDNRIHLRPSSWSDLGEALLLLGSDVKQVLGLKNWLLWKLLRKFKHLENLITVLTVWSSYQLHLVLVSMITLKRQGQDQGKMWNWTLAVLNERLPENAMVHYLQNNKAWFHAELPHMWNRVAASKPPMVWPWAFSAHVIAARHMPSISIQYMEYLLKDMK